MLSRLLLARPGPSFRNFHNSRPLYFAHRGCGLLFPEETLLAYRRTLAAGFPSVEMDMHILSDGVTPAPMHDDTVDRMTDGTGDMNTFSPSQFVALTIDNTVLGVDYGTLNPPLASSVLREMKGRALFLLENKTGSSVPMLNAVLAAGIRKDQILFGEFGTTAGGYAVSRGYQGFISVSTDSTASISAAVAAGIQWVFLNADAATAPTVAAWIAAGLKVMMYTVNRRSVRDTFLAMGVTGFFTDDPLYLSRNTPWATRDTWSTGEWMPGQLDENFAMGPTTRGRISNGRCGWTDQGKRFHLQGWACPVKSDPLCSDYSITFKVKFGTPTTSARWASIWVSAPSMGDYKYANDGAGAVVAENGYHFLMRSSSGVLDVYKSVSGTATLLQSVDTPDIAVDEEVQYRVTVSPTQMALYRLDGSGGVTHSNVVTNSDVERSGYFHTGHSACGAEFSEMVIT